MVMSYPVYKFTLLFTHWGHRLSSISHSSIANCSECIRIMWIFSMNVITLNRNNILISFLFYLIPIAVEDAKAYREKQSKLENGRRRVEPVEHVLQVETVQRHYDAFVLATDTDIEHVVKIIETMEMKGLSVCIRRIPCSIHMLRIKTKRKTTIFVLAGVPQRRSVGWNVRTSSNNRSDCPILRTSDCGIHTCVHAESRAIIFCNTRSSDGRWKMQTNRDPMHLR